MILGSLKKSKKRILEDLKPREQDTKRTSGNTTRIDPFPPSLIREAQTQPGHLAARLGCAETKVSTWDDLAFKLITLSGSSGGGRGVLSIGFEGDLVEKRGLVCLAGNKIYSAHAQYFKNVTVMEVLFDTYQIIKSGVEKLVPILSENEVTSEDKRECDVPVCENSSVCDDHYEIFSDSNNDDDILSDDDAFEDIEYVEASLPDPEIVNVVLREKLLSINRLIANIESLNDNPTPDHVLNSSISFPIFEESDNSLSDNFSPEFETFCDHTEETRSGSTITHANDSLPEYDSFCFEMEPDQERLINVVKSNISDDSSNDPLLEEAGLFLAFDNSIPPGIENFADNSEGDIRFLEALLIDDSILSHESSDSNFEDNPSVSLPPPKPPDAKTNAGEEISVVRNTIVEFECLNPRIKFDVPNDENDDYSSFIFVIFAKVFSLLFAESEDTIFDPGKDYAQNVKKQSKPRQYQTQDWKSTSKAESTGIFHKQSAKKAKITTDSKIKDHSWKLSKVKTREKDKSKFQGLKLPFHQSYVQGTKVAKCSNYSYNWG
nr:hypothetical protein [Tanacetum cinerariifolium]